MGEVLDFEYVIHVTHCKPQPSWYHHVSPFHPRFILYCISQASTIGVMIPVSPQTSLAASGSWSCFASGCSPMAHLCLWQVLSGSTLLAFQMTSYSRCCHASTFRLRITSINITSTLWSCVKFPVRPQTAEAICLAPRAIRGRSCLAVCPKWRAAAWERTCWRRATSGNTWRTWRRRWSRTFPGCGTLPGWRPDGNCRCGEGEGWRSGRLKRCSGESLLDSGRGIYVPWQGYWILISMDVNDGTKTVDPRKSRFLFEFGSSSVLGWAKCGPYLWWWPANRVRKRN